MTDDIFRASQVKFKGNQFDTKRVQMMVMNAMRKQGNEMKRELESTVEFWEHRPIFKYKMHWKGGDVYIEILLGGSQISQKYWHYVNEGTRWRRVIFHPFYIPKSAYPGSFYSNTRGLYTKTIRTPTGYDPESKIQGISPRRLRGIRARNWVTLLREKHKWPYAKDIERAVRKGLNK